MIGRLFDRFASAVTHAAGHWVALIAATVVVVAWWATDRTFDWLDAVSAVTLWMMFSLQHAQNRDTKAMQVKLDELLRALPEADDDLRGIERGEH